MAIPAILGRFLIRSAGRQAAIKLGGLAASNLGASLGGSSGGSRLSISGVEEVVKMLDKLEDMAPEVMEDAGIYFRNKTPVRSGNARNQTKTQDTTIHARYGYAKRLNDGYSSQASDGMTDPTIKEMKKLVRNYIRGL